MSGGLYVSGKLVLHIGTHKTATTSIQHFFSKNREALRFQGIFYPSQDIIDAPKHYAHLRIAHGIANEDPIVSPEAARQFFKIARDMAKPHETIFVSAEPFYRHKLTPPAGSRETTTSAFRAYAEAVKEAVGSDGARIMILLRRQDLFTESLYGEHVLSTGYEDTISNFVEERSALLDYRARLQTWASVFGEDAIMVRAFEPEFFQTSIERTLVEWLGCEWSDRLEQVRRFNDGLNKSFVEYKRRINRPSQSKQFNKKLRAALSKIANKKFARKFKAQDKYYFSPRARHELMERYDEDNRWVSRTFLGKDSLFHRGLDEDTRKFQADPLLSDKEFELITHHLVQALAHGD